MMPGVAFLRAEWPQLADEAEGSESLFDEANIDSLIAVLHAVRSSAAPDPAAA